MRMVVNFMRYRNLCIRNNLFTAGTNEQYDKVYAMMQNGGISIHDLALVTYICSSGFTLEQIKGMLSQEFKSL